MRRSVPRLSLLACLIAIAVASRVDAAPLLQLDIVGGHYDSSSQTMVAGGNPFTLVALATPQGNVSANEILNETYYVSAAISPGVSQPGGNFGSFTVNGQTINATSGMTYGTPPIEDFAQLQGHDSGDLSQHGIYPTYFTEFAFQFSAGSTTPTYNTATGQDQPGTSYRRTFQIDTSNLSPQYVIHFDLYDTQARNCSRSDRQVIGTSCVDIDRDHFAPFSHDAESAPPVPEPATMLLLGTGLAAGAVRRLRRKRGGANA